MTKIYWNGEIVDLRGVPEVFVEDPEDPGNYVTSRIYVGETDPAVGGDVPYVWLPPSAIASTTPMKKARRSSGDITLNSTNWANVDTGLDLTLTGVSAGDEILYGISARVDVETVAGFFDVVTVVSGSPVNSFASRTSVVSAPGNVISGWRTDSTAERQTISGDAPPYTVVSGDLTSGSLTLRLRYATGAASNLTLKATSTTTLDVWARNIGPLQT